jgi:orotidine-5'-phosphate decarboxylase
MSNTVMRAKMQVGMVQENCHRVNAQGQWDTNAEPTKVSETLSMHAVAKNGYDASGLDEDNTYAKMSPGAQPVHQHRQPQAVGQVQARRQVLRGLHAGRPMTHSELKVEALRAANQAVGTQVSSRAYSSMGGMGQTHPQVSASQVLEEAKRIYAWLTERPESAA